MSTGHDTHGKKTISEVCRERPVRVSSILSKPDESLSVKLEVFGQAHYFTSLDGKKCELVSGAIVGRQQIFDRVSPFGESSGVDSKASRCLGIEEQERILPHRQSVPPRPILGASHQQMMLVSKLC